MSDNLRNDQSDYQTKNISTFPISYLYQKFYNINSIKSKNSYSYPRPKMILLQIEMFIIVLMNVYVINNYQESMKCLEE